MAGRSNHGVFDEEWLKEYCRKNGMHVEGNAVVRGAKPDAPNDTKPVRRKYGNTRVTDEDGLTFDSKHEQKCYEMLKLEAKAGQWQGIARQVTFYLPGGVKYIADFVCIRDGVAHVMDAKSDATRKDKVYRLKKRQMKDCLGLEIEEI